MGVKEGGEVGVSEGVEEGVKEGGEVGVSESERWVLVRGGC